MVLAVLPLLGLSALCPSLSMAQPAASPAEQACKAADARFARGEPYTPELAERARRAAGARSVRKIEPGGAYTMDLDPNRLNIEVDRTGIVSDLDCG